MHVGIVGFRGDRDAHDYEHSPIPIAIEVSRSFSVRPCSPLSMDHTGIPKISTGLQQTYSDGGTRILIPLQTAKGKNRCNQKKPHSTNHLSANAICLCKWDAKNNTTKSCTICWNMLDAGGSRQRAHRAKYLFSSARGCPCRTVSPADLPKSMPLWLSANAHISALSDSVSWFHIGTIPTVGNMPSVWDRLPLAALGPPKH